MASPFPDLWKDVRNEFRELQAMRDLFFKVIRTLQSRFPMARTAKENIQRLVRRTLRIPHERDFEILGLIDFTDRVFVDVGANRGQSIDSAKVIRPDVRIVSFEPNPLLSKRLSRIYGNDPSITIREVGLSDIPGEFKLFTPTYQGYLYDGLSSLSYESASSWISNHTVFFFDARQLRIDEAICSITTLDIESVAPGLIKIDVQGTEGKVIRGALKTIERYKPVVLVERDVGMNEVRELLAPLGYAEYRVANGRLEQGAQPGDNAILMTSDTHVRLQGLGGGP
jgi:FkbM family methyltransferase